LAIVAGISIDPIQWNKVNACPLKL
jgi:hypothetical protein